MESGGLAMTVTAKRLEEISYEFRHDASDTELTVTTQSLRDVSDHMRFQATEIERLTRELSIAKGGYQDPQFHDAVVISKARVTQFENEIERLTRERDEAERIAAVRLQSIQKHADKHAEAVACAEAAEARLAALSAPVGNDRIRQTISILESAADGLRSPGSRIWIDDVALDVRRLASSLTRARQDALEDAARLVETIVVSGRLAEISYHVNAGVSMKSRGVTFAALRDLLADYRALAADERRMREALEKIKSPSPVFIDENGDRWERQAACAKIARAALNQTGESR